ncbi:probable mRNA-capping enzyme subunit alpha [Saccharomycodes ludwigii]|uniref:mRNA-capping enzyme subunit alpha n=1 Tax=Saccharomycodes ludwigii TaxID=36035 RepID=A0A376B985_9ASCO|nr:hypothetical protein SCDLUD_001115 [Saccharomycodes ludwigii]KAH3903475.1 hypothetical protein SCDLUD_001115 [Saccharomycodes ludwigii]SSD61258.1 probable mRNA-capping enzyme subunit alpha [Saccharomycodes ludwigii]
MVSIDRNAPEIPGIKQPSNVTNDLKAIISRILNSPKPLRTFLGSQPVSFQKQDIGSKLLSEDYYVCEKTDGIRVIMFLVVNPVTQEQGCFLIDRENNFFLTSGFQLPLPKHLVPPEQLKDEEGKPIKKDPLLRTFQNGTLVDGELVIQTNPQTKIKELRYLMFDCLSINGRSLVHSPTSSRLAHLGHDFYKPYFDLRVKYPEICQNFPFKLSMKQMMFSYDLVKVAKSLNNLPHVSDGLIFTPVLRPYVIGGKDQLLLKWKPEEENTVDFKLVLEIAKYYENSKKKNKTSDWYYNYDVKPLAFNLYVWQGGSDSSYKSNPDEPFNEKDLKILNNTYSKFAELTVSEEEWKKLLSLNEPINGRIVECGKDQDTGEWKLLRFRDDKLNGNHISVVQNVLESINDAVTIEDLESEAADIKKKWDNRHNKNNKNKYVDDEDDEDDILDMF